MIRSRLFLRLFTTIIAVVCLFSAAIYVFSVPLIQAKAYEIELNASRTVLDNVFEMATGLHGSLEEQRAVTVDSYKRQLKNVVSLAANYIDYVFSRMDAGEITETEARRLVFEGLRAFKYGNNDYIWVSDYDSTLLSHPDPAFQGRNAAEIRDEAGGAILPTIIEIARSQGQGFHTYPWPKLGVDGKPDKISYFMDLPHRRMVVGTGAYLDDIDAEVARRKARAINDLRNALRKIRIARTGYVYIFDADNHMLIHPNANIEGTEFGRLQDPATGQLISEELKQAADRSDPLFYMWDKPDDPGMYAYEKISWVRHFPGFNWYIASSVYVDELRKSSAELGNRILTIAIVVTILAGALGYVAARLLVRPLNRLADTAARVQAGDLQATSGIQRDDEIGVLAATFDGMVHRLRDNIAGLDTRVRERTQALEEANARLREAMESQERAQSALAEAQRLKAVGQLSGGLAHDFNNLLSIILGNLAAARDRFKGVDGLAHYLDPAERASRRGADITSRLLAFARRQPLRPEPVEVRGLVGEVAVLLRRTLPPSIDLRAPEETGPCWAIADPNQLENALVNLALNARDAMPDGGSLDISIHPRDVAEPLAFDESVPPGAYVEIVVADTGQGFAPEALARAFEPFFTTKSLGSGLGLSMVYGFVKQSHGFIHMDSAPGRGCRATILLPRGEAPEPAQALPAAPCRPAAQWQGCLALVAEDNEDVRAIMRDQLVDLGFSVLEAANGDDAAELVEQVEELSLVVSDIVMPGLSGLDLARRIRATRPAVKVVLVSGFSVESSADMADLCVLRKPWDKGDLIAAIGHPGDMP